MRDLEEAFRQGLAELADETDASSTVVRRVLDRVRSDRRRRAGVVAVVVAAAAVAVVAGGALVLVPRDAPDRATPGTPSTRFAGTAPSAPAGYRLELWHDVGVYVPATWAWGTAPVQDSAGPAVLCGAGTVVEADGARRRNPSQPYVGRPVRLTGDCGSGWEDARPTASYVWLGAGVTAGTVDLGDGWVRETVDVGDVPVTVASDDAALRRAILDSAHRVVGECAASMDDPPVPGGSATAAGFVPDAMTVCAYAPTSTGLDFDLVDREQLSAGPAKALVAAVEHAAPLGSASCFDASGGEWVLLRLRGAGGSWRDYVVDLSCPSIADPGFTQHELTGEVVRSWAVGGVNTAVHTRALTEVPDRSIPPLP